jgi:hypothetical protein
LMRLCAREKLSRALADYSALRPLYYTIKRCALHPAIKGFSR